MEAERGSSDPQLAERNLAAALTLLEALLEAGLAALVLCPGSRSAPLALAAGLLESRGLRLLTGIDERSAAFWALGYSRAAGRAAAVVTTSGTAVANLLPACVEADMGAIPLLLLSADRPARLKRCGANQTVDQERFLTAAVRWLGEGDGRGLAAMAAADLQRLAATAMTWAQGGQDQPPGAVHLNLPFDEPLHCGVQPWQQQQLRAGASAILAVTSDAVTQLPPAEELDPDRPGVVVAGPWRGAPSQWGSHCSALRRWLRRSGWPLLADPLSGLRGEAGTGAIASYDLLLASAPAALTPPQVLRLGPLPASRRMQQWLADLPARQLLISEGEPRRLDPLGRAQQWSHGLARWCAALPPQQWQGAASSDALALQQRWNAAEAAVQGLLERELNTTEQRAEPLSEPALARALSRVLPVGLPLVLANSSPVRDWESFAAGDAPPRPIIGFRGASGIDGTLSSACGVAEALGEALLLCGDLALLHDSNGWLWQQQLQGRLTVVLINNGGGGIFEQLPIRHPNGGMDFERLFAMPQPVDPGLLCAAHGVPHRRRQPGEPLDGLLRWAFSHRLAVLEVCTDRGADAALRQRLRTMATELVAEQ